MSQFKLEKDNIEAMYGVDHTTSVFLTIFDLSYSKDEPVISVNNQGVVVSEYTFNEKQIRIIENTKLAFAEAKSRGNDYPNLDSTRLTKLLNMFDLNVTELEVLRNLD